jgi:hypothetical protein
MNKKLEDNKEIIENGFSESVDDLQKSFCEDARRSHDSRMMNCERR